NLRSRYLTFFDSEDSRSIEKDIIDTKEEVDRLQTVLSNEHKGVKKYQIISDRLKNCKIELQVLAESIHGQLSSQKKTEAEKRFIFYFYHVIPYLNDELVKIEQDYALTVPKLDTDLISKLVEEFDSSLDQANSSEKGKEKELINF